ncbi:MAG: nucleoside hydrolase [Terriglobia bacterium]|nr:nucleoside hydrolase [Terriglobia bacterium]
MTTCASAQASRYVVIDQDAMGPAGTDMNSILVFLQAPNVKVLGITVPTGDGWRNEEVAHALRLLELMGRTDIPVVPGAASPLIRTEQWTQEWEQMHGKISYQGAWSSFRPHHAPDQIPPMREGSPRTKPDEEGAAHFLVRMVHKYPHQVTIYAAGPMTDIAQAITLDPQFAELAKELVIMGGSLNPRTNDLEFADDPHHEFNLWFDPEASSMTLHAHWAKITATTVDVSIETRLTTEMVEKLSQTHSDAAQYIARYTERRPGDFYYMWDELAAAAWLDPSLITHERYVYMDVSLDKGSSYGDTLVWSDADKPALDLQKVHVQMDVDSVRFEKFFLRLMSYPTPHAVNSKTPQDAAAKAR